MKNVEMLSKSALRDMRNTYKISVGTPEEKTPHGIPRNRLEFNIKMYFKETE
jgi:hypothetical protein